MCYREIKVNPKKKKQIKELNMVNFGDWNLKVRQEAALFLTLKALT